MLKRKTLVAIAGASLAAWPAAAQQSVDAGTIVFENWNYDELYSSTAWSVDEFFEREVADSAGEEIGDVEDLVLNDDGDIVALIAEVGGFWDIGDTHVSVPWEMVDVGSGGMVGVPVTEENIADFDIFSSAPLPLDAGVDDQIVEGVDDEYLGMGLWRASDLIGDYVRIQGEDRAWVNFGYVSDLLIDEGSVSATLVSTAAGYGRGTYAYPYRGGTAQGYGLWRPDAVAQDLPVLVGDATSLPWFDEDRMQSN